MLPAVALAEDDEVDFQYSHYEEGKRKYNANSTLHPIQVDSVIGKARISLKDRVKFAFNYIQDTWSGATPITSAPLAANSTRTIRGTTPSGQVITTGASPYINSQLYLNRHFVPIANNYGKKVSNGAQPVDVLAMASPETRKQGDFNLAYEWDEAALRLGGGVSTEHDYNSRFVNMGGRLDFNKKLTTMDLGLSYTNSDTHAILDHDAYPYIDTTAYNQQITATSNNTGGMHILSGNRQDWGTSLALTQVLNKSALLETQFGFTRSTGYMANPYKAMSIVFVDPTSFGQGLPNAYTGDVQAFLEKRPDHRNQFTAGTRYIQHIGFADAALHLDYRYFHDNWGIDAHTFEADWVQPITSTWTVTPKIRYYSQDAASFYHPYLVSKQAYVTNNVSIDPNTGMIVNNTVYYNPALLPKNYSSDQRLSAYGALSGGVTINKKLSKAVSLETGFEYYTHQGALKLGGGGNGNFNDFNYYQINAALNVNLAALDVGTGGTTSTNSGKHDHTNHADHQKGRAPAGVMFDHMLGKTNEVMIGYRFMYSDQSGNTLDGSQAASDPQIRNNACVQGYGHHCRVTPTYMDMSMHMLDIMYAPTSWLNLMLMPQFMDMDMNFRALKGVTVDPTVDHLHGGHRTGGIGDTGLYSMFKLFDRNGQHLHLTLGVTAPTGDVDITMRRMHRVDEGYMHYGMQLGSGTWDLKPSLTYTGQLDDWSWGAQMSGTKRMGSQNASGYALGDIYQATTWGGYSLTKWLAGTLRAVYTEQNKIRGGFNPLPGVNASGVAVSNVNPGSPTNYSTGSVDFTSNYGGRFWDIGFGLNVTVPSGAFKGHHLGVEWLQPVGTDFNGYQLQRQGTLSANWSMMF